MVEGKKNFKLVMIGESGTGKTSIVARYDKDTFTPNGRATIGSASLISKNEIV